LTASQEGLSSMSEWVSEWVIIYFADVQPLRTIVQCFSTAEPRPGTGPSSYRKMNLPGRGLTKVKNHWTILYNTIVQYNNLRESSMTMVLYGRNTSLYLLENKMLKYNITEFILLSLRKTQKAFHFPQLFINHCKTFRHMFIIFKRY
jgi:hypothetical protein